MTRQRVSGGKSILAKAHQASGSEKQSGLIKGWRSAQRASSARCALRVNARSVAPQQLFQRTSYARIRARQLALWRSGGICCNGIENKAWRLSSSATASYQHQPRHIK